MDMAATTPTCPIKSHDLMHVTAVNTSDTSGMTITYLNNDDVGAGSVDGSGALLAAGATVPFRPDSDGVDDVETSDLVAEAFTAGRAVTGMVSVGR